MEIEQSLQIDAIKTREQMQERLVDIASGGAYLRDLALQERVREIWHGGDGDGGSASELFVEGIFPAVTSQKSIDDLTNDGCFSSALRDQLKRAGFPIGRPLYEHQRRAIDISRTSAGPRPVVVIRAGTGMGKTEAFLLPLLDDIYSKPRQGGQDGVRAIVLYPMNALVNDQVERLHGWLAGQSKCRLLHFTGETPEDDVAADKIGYPRHDDGSRIRTRSAGRQNPPDVLVTNYSMLEYMLIRPQDAPFFGKDLRVIVLDEMHLYSGTLAAEIALLLRRVLLRCGLSPEDVLCLGASATLGGDLKEFSAALFSRSPADVQILEGHHYRRGLNMPAPPARTPEPIDVPNIFPDRPFLDGDGLVTDPELARGVAKQCATLAGPDASASAQMHPEPARSLAEMLSRAPIMRRMENELWTATERRDIVSLDRLSQEVWGRVDPDSRRATEKLLRLGARARWSKDELPLFPHKLHFLVRSPVVPMACVNPDCSRDEGYHLPGAGPVLSGSRELCPHCASQTLPLHRCKACGEWFFAAVHDTKDNRYRPMRDGRDDDSNDPGGVRLRPATQGDSKWFHYQLVDGRRESRSPYVKMAQHDDCPVCGENDFGPVQLSDTEGLSVSAETMLASMPPLPGSERKWLPAEGRRLIAFNDSRQSAASLGPGLTSTHEIQMSRAMLADCLSETVVNDAKLARLRNREASLLQELRTAAGTERELAEDELQKCREDIRAAEAGGKIQFWLDRLRRQGLVSQFFDRERGQSDRADNWNQQRWEANREAIAKGLDEIMAREFAVPVPTILGLETIGLAEIVYPGLDGMMFPAAIAGRMPDEESRARLMQTWPELLAALCDTVRMDYCVTLSDPEKDRSAASYPIGRWMSLADRADRPRTLVRFLPVGTRPTRRKQFVASVLVAAGCAKGVAEALTTPVLTAAFDQLLAAAKDRTLGWLEVADRQTAAASSVEAFRILFFELGLRPPRQAFLCPSTGAVWPRVVLGCAPIKGSQGGLAPITAERLDTHPRVSRARRAYRDDGALRLGLWADEHSAQLASDENRRLQELFAMGARNVLSATTTMEVGIDIGGLSGAFMANMPPGLANYLQRGGRAGRRTDGASIVCTFARRRPYDQAAFDDFASFFRRDLRRANVMLEREGIALRHLQAMLLGDFFQTIRPLGARSGAMDAFGHIGAFCGVPNLDYLDADRVGAADLRQPTPIQQNVRRPEMWWRAEFEPDLSAEFLLYLEHLASVGGEVRARAVALAAGTGFAHRVADWPAFIGGVCDRFQEAIGEWRDDYDRVVRAWREQASQDRAGQRARMNALARQAHELRSATVVEELGNRKFLPRYGFPIGLNSLLVNADRKAPSRFKLQRDGAQAVTEYVPGSTIIVGGQFVRSRGVQKAWGENGEDMVGVTLWRYKCENGHSKCLKVIEQQHGACGVDGCSAPMLQQKPERLLVPRYGYATAASEPPSWHRERGSPVGIPDMFINHVQNTRIQSRTNFGEFFGLTAEFHENVELLAINSGAKQCGFALCPSCGFADSETAPEASGALDLPSAFGDHIPLYRSRGGKCGGGAARAAPLRKVTFAAQQFTDLVRFEFVDITGMDRTALVTLGHALAQGAAEVLELDQREIRVALNPGDWVVRVFDATGHGGGHMAELFRRDREWLAATRQVLWRSERHNQKCRTACITCILSSVSQRDASNGLLDRRAALAVIDRVGGGAPGTLRAEAVDPPGKPADTLRESNGALTAEIISALRARRIWKRPT